MLHKNMELGISIQCHKIDLFIREKLSQITSWVAAGADPGMLSSSERSLGSTEALPTSSVLS